MSKIIVEFHLPEKNVTKVVGKIQDLIANPFRYDKLSVGNCGWANRPDCWWIRIPMKVEERKELVDWIIEEEIELYNPALIC